MANHVNLTFDTIGPDGVEVKINGDDVKTASTAVTLSITCGDADLTGYQMKIWGTESAENEASASWETYQNTKNVTLPAGDGIKTVYVKVRDDVWNESTAVSDTVTFYEKEPAVIGLDISKAKVSLVNGQNTTGGSFGYDENIDAVKVMIVQDINATHDDPLNIVVPTANGSKIEAESGEILSTDYMEFENRFCNNVFTIMYYIDAADIAAVSPGDGIKIIKVFVRSDTSKKWSV